METRQRNTTSRYIVPCIVGVLLIAALIPVADVMSVLGFINDKTYIIALHDNAEIRNSGGTLSCIGMLTLHNGNPTDLKIFYSSHEGATGVVELDGPESFTGFFGTNKVQLYDANLQYDFASFAPLLVANADNDGQTVDGVIAMDFTAVRQIMSIIGPVTVSGQVLTSRNVADQLYAHSSTSKDDLTTFMLELATTLLKDVRDAPALQKMDLIREARELGDERHLQVYLPGDFLLQGYDGARARPSGDFIEVLDYNLGSGKADPGVNRTTSYNVELHADGSSTSRLTLQYANHNWWEYDVFATVLIPPSATLVSAHLTPEWKGPRETHEGDVTALAARLIVPPNTTGSITYTYTMPRNVYGDAIGLHYDLYIQKQAGIDAYKVTSAVQLPQDATPVHAENVGSQTMRDDVHVQVIYRP